MSLDCILKRHRIPETDRPAFRRLELGIRPDGPLLHKLQTGKHKKAIDAAMLALTVKKCPHKFPSL